VRLVRGPRGSWPAPGRPHPASHRSWSGASRSPPPDLPPTSHHWSSPPPHCRRFLTRAMAYLLPFRLCRSKRRSTSLREHFHCRARRVRARLSSLDTRKTRTSRFGSVVGRPMSYVYTNSIGRQRPSRDHGQGGEFFSSSMGRKAVRSTRIRFHPGGMAIRRHLRAAGRSSRRRA